MIAHNEAGPRWTVPDLGPQPDPTTDEHATDVGNGRRLVRMYGDQFRWTPSLGWIVWNGRIWERDEAGLAVEALAKDSARVMRQEAAGMADPTQRTEAWKHATRSEKSERIRAAVAMARSERGVSVEPDDLDADPYELSVGNGTLDLRTGALSGHDYARLITRGTEVEYHEEAPCPRWEAFLEETFCGDSELVAFIQKAVGYSLTGDTREQCLFLCHGVGSNGKSTLLSMLRHVAGGNASHADFSTFLVNKNQGSGPRGDLARLAGVRLVTSTEPDAAGRLSESTVKAITGQDPITCSFKFKNEFTYAPRFKLWLAANHKPRIRGVDHAIWRRIRLVPFNNIVPDDKQDKGLVDALVAEAPGILAWAVRGAMRWLAEGLAPPKAVQGATEAYRAEQDTLAEFIEECCYVAPGFDCPINDLYRAYKEWAASEDEDRPLSKKSLGNMLTERGFPPSRADDEKRTRIRIGLRVR